MHIYDPDATGTAAGRPHTADNSLSRITSRRSRHLSTWSSTTSSSAAGLSDGDSFILALDAFARPQSECGVRRTSNDGLQPRMGSTTTITAAAAARAASGANWPGGIMRETDIQVESRELAGLDAELRRRSKRLPREDGRWVRGDDSEALRDLANFLRDVTPPPGNYMSVRTPTSPSRPSSVASSIRRRRSGRRASTLRRCFGVLMRKGNGKTKKVSRRHSNDSLRSVSRAPSIRKKRWPLRIRLPDTAVAGTTVEGHRHIAISIPIEHAHLGPEPRYKFPKREKQRRSRPVSDVPPRIYHDINVRPFSAMFSEPHIGTQLGPVAEERESLSSKTPSWERTSFGSSHVAGGLHDPAEVRKVRLASRNTFGTVHEECQIGSASGSNSANNSRPGTRSGSSPVATPLTPSRHSSSGEYIRPRTPAASGRHSSDEIVRKAHRMGAFAALTSATSRPDSASAHSLRSFTSASPGGTSGRIFYPKRNSSLQPSTWPETPTDGAKQGRGRGRTGQGTVSQHLQQRQHSRDSSRDQYTLQESIFSEASYLESSHTVDSGGAAPGPVVSRAVTRDRTPSRRGEEGETTASGRTSRDSGDKKRWSAGTGAGQIEDETKRAKRQRPLTETVLASSRSTEQLRRPSREVLASEGLAPTSDRNPKSKELDHKAPSASTQETNEDGSSARRDDGDMPTGRTEQDALMESPKLVAGQVSGPREKGKETETPLDESSPEALTKTKPQEQSQDAEDKTATPIPSPKERRQRRKSVRLSRKHRIAELRKVLEKPDAQPEDLVWERRLSSSSEESNGATPKASPSSSPRRDRRQASPQAQRRRPKTLPAYLSFTPVLTVADLRPSSPADSSEEGRPSSSQHADTLLDKKESVSFSLSSPTTVATVVKNSPVPPFQSLGSVTPPQSPPASSNSPSTPSPSSELYSQQDEPRSSSRSASLRPQPPLKRLSSFRRRASIAERSPSAGAGLGGIPSSPGHEGVRGSSSPLRPKTAGKGVVSGSRKRDYFFGASGPSFGHEQQQQPDLQPNPSSPVTSPATSSSAGTNRIEHASGAGAAAASSGAKMKSALKMTRSELFERYEAMRDNQARDMERRIRRLEKHGDYWLTSMIPLLTDLSQTLGQLALGGSDQQNQSRQQDNSGKKEKGKEVVVDGINDDEDDRARGTIYADGRKSRFGIRSTPAVNEVGLEPFSSERPSTSSFYPSEELVRHHGRARPYTAGSGRLYLHGGSDGSHHPGIGYRVRIEDHDTREDTEAGYGNQIHGSPSVTTTPNRHHERANARSSRPRKHQEHRAASGSTTMVDNSSINNAARANSMGTKPGSFRTTHRSSSSLHGEYKRESRNPTYALHANTPLSRSATEFAFETERLARIERLNDHIDARIRSLPLSGGYGNNEDGAARPHNPSRLRHRANRSQESLETYQGTTDDDGDSGIEDDDHYFSSRESGARRGTRAHRQVLDSVVGMVRGRGTGMETVTPLMRELQANGSRLSLESDGSCGQGDSEVNALRRGPEPRSVIGFGAFR